jgi:hypothetical protein
MRRYTLSREKEEIEAILPVLKKADWRRKKKKREMRASERVRERYDEDLSLVRGERRLEVGWSAGFRFEGGLGLVEVVKE